MANYLQEDGPWQRPLYSSLSASTSKLPSALYNQSSTSLSSMNKGSHFRKLQELLQDIEQDEEERLAQIQRDPELVFGYSDGPQTLWTNVRNGRATLEPPMDKNGTINRRKSSPSISNAAAAYRTAGLYGQKVSELQASNAFRPSFETDSTSDASRLAEMEASPSIRIAGAAELEAPYNETNQPHKRSRSFNGVPEMPGVDFSSSFADVDAIISATRNTHASYPPASRGYGSLSMVGKHELPASFGRDHRLSKLNGMVELDASPSLPVIELPGEAVHQASVEQHSQLQQVQQWGYGHRKYRTLPGEAFPIMEREPSPGREGAVTMKSSLLPTYSSNDTKPISHPHTGSRTGSPYGRS